MSLFAVARLRFWAFPAWVMAFGVVSVVAESHVLPWAYLSALAGIAVAVALTVPIWTLSFIWKSSYEYARTNEKYASLYRLDSLVWRIPGRTFDVPFSLVERARLNRGVVILELNSSRAVCVLPSELVPKRIVDAVKTGGIKGL
jgi:hypothetical protein